VSPARAARGAGPQECEQTEPNCSSPEKKGRERDKERKGERRGERRKSWWGEVLVCAWWIFSGDIFRIVSLKKNNLEK